MISLLNQLAFNIGEEFQLKEGAGISNAPGYGSIGEFISTILPNVYVVSSLILFILLLAGGFAIITSGNDPQQKNKGTKALTGAVVGFAIIFASFWLIKLIEYLTGIAIFSPNI